MVRKPGRSLFMTSRGRGDFARMGLTFSDKNEAFLMRGQVYILTNPSMPGLVKIGHTERDSGLRASELYTTGVPAEFEVYWSVEVSNPRQVEMDTHRRLAGYRSNPKREYFEISPEEAKRHLAEIAAPYQFRHSPRQVRRWKRRLVIVALALLAFLSYTYRDDLLSLFRPADPQQPADDLETLIAEANARVAALVERARREWQQGNAEQALATLEEALHVPHANRFDDVHRQRTAIGNAQVETQTQIAIDRLRNGRFRDAVTYLEIAVENPYADQNHEPTELRKRVAYALGETSLKQAFAQLTDQERFDLEYGGKLPESLRSGIPALDRHLKQLAERQLENEQSAQQKLERARTMLSGPEATNNESTRQTGERWLREIIQFWPETEAADEAQRLLSGSASGTDSSE